MSDASRSQLMTSWSSSPTADTASDSGMLDLPESVHY